MAKKKIGEIYNKPIVIGDKNIVNNNEIHVDELNKNKEQETILLLCEYAVNTYESQGCFFEHSVLNIYSDYSLNIHKGDTVYKSAPDTSYSIDVFLIDKVIADITNKKLIDSDNHNVTFSSQDSYDNYITVTCPNALEDPASTGRKYAIVECVKGPNDIYIPFINTAVGVNVEKTKYMYYYNSSTGSIYVEFVYDSYDSYDSYDPYNSY